jgi:putative mRNA 3-end processing factor
MVLWECPAGLEFAYKCGMENWNDLLVSTSSGLYCPPGGFYLDPWNPVSRAIITHAHGDHLRAGSDHYLVSREGLGVFQSRAGLEAAVTALPYGETIEHNGVKITLFPAGHILGSAQVRLEYQGRIAVLSGDYKTFDSDTTCTPFEPVRCHLFITESTFGLPIYQWEPQQRIFDQINAWWRSCRDQGQTAMLFAYSLGKTQRLLSGLDPSIGPIWLHGAGIGPTEAYRREGILLPPTKAVAESPAKHDFSGSIVIAPPSVDNTPWMNRFKEVSTGFASGWMRIRGGRRRQSLDRGFVLSDHADWPGLHEAIAATGASTIWVTHGSVPTLVRHLLEKGYEARPIKTQFVGDRLEETPVPQGEETPSVPGEEALTKERKSSGRRAKAKNKPEPPSGASES